MDPLVKALRRLRIRIALIQWTRFFVLGLIAGTSTACVWLILTRLFPQLGRPEIVSLSLLTLGIVAATAFAIIRRPSILGTVLAADGQLKLKERLTSSYQLADAEGPMIEALHDDARNFLDNTDLSQGFPLAIPPKTRWIAVPLLVYLATALAMPEFDLFKYREKQEKIEQQMKVQRVHAERLRNAARELREEMVDEVADLSDIAEGVERIAEGVEIGEISEKQAFSRLTDLAKDLAEEREKLSQENPTPGIEGDTSQLGALSEIAEDMKDGKFANAADKLEELKEKLEEKLKAGELSEEAAKDMAADMQQLAKMLSKGDSAMGQAMAKALAQAAAGLEKKDMAATMAALEAMDMSLADAASLMQQLQAMDMAMGSFGEAQAELLGRQLGQGFGKGFGSDYFAEGGGGLGGPGRGRGNRIGELPDGEGALEETMLSGDMTKGKILASIMQRAAPDPDVESDAEFVAQALTEITQQAEQALTKEEIPPGAKEFVRQYFGSLEPEGARGNRE